jgi:hypothetical protein
MEITGENRLIPRFVPDEPLPPYAFVPGRFPHPISDPAGHSFGRAREPAAPFDPAAWAICRPYLYGIDLFNYGYYWEAHEEWESLWHVAGRTGPVADFLKGLIKLAAAGVKAREGIPEGAKSHARRAAALFRQCEPMGERVMGLAWQELAQVADLIAVADTPSDHSFSFKMTPIV